jgi:anaphase-promoting complex subunit 7
MGFAPPLQQKVARRIPFLISSSQRRRRSNNHGETSPLFMSIPTPLDTLTSGLASMCRIPKGVNVVATTSSSSSQQPPSSNNIVLKRLYDVETDVACKKVRERITEYDLVVELVVPATKNSRARLWSDYEYALTTPPKSSSSSIGATTTTTTTTWTILPQLVVSENGVERTLVGDQDIIAYLDSKFQPPSPSLEPTQGESTTSTSTITVTDSIVELLRDALGFVSTVLRWGRGVEVCSAASSKRSNVPRPQKPLILYSYEGNQFCRLVREVLTELDLPYQLRSAGKGSPRRQEELAKLTDGGSTMCPYLVDPNTQTNMAESADIIRYLYKTYALWTPPYELLRFTSDFMLPLISPVFQALAPFQAQMSSSDATKVDDDLEEAMTQIEQDIEQHPVVIYTYQLSPFSLEAKALLDNLGIDYKEVSLGLEWIPGLLKEPHKRAALLKLTGQSSLPHVFIGGKSIGGLFSGTPGLVPALEQDKLKEFLDAAAVPKSTPAPSSSSGASSVAAEPSAETLGSFE